MALHRILSTQKLAVEKRQEMHFLGIEEKEKWIKDYVGRETAGARKQVEDAEAVVHQAHEDIDYAKTAGLISREHKRMFEVMLVAIGQTLIVLSSVDHVKHGEDEDEEIEQGTHSEDDEPGWVTETTTKTIPQCMSRFRYKLIKLHELQE